MRRHTRHRIISRRAKEKQIMLDRAIKKSIYTSHNPSETTWGEESRSLEMWEESKGFEKEIDNTQNACIESSVWDRFEKKYLTCYTQYYDRYAALQKEFYRIGMRDVEVLWDFPSPYRNILLDNVPMTSFCKKKNLFFIGQSNYRAIATAYYLGAQSVLIMQDDIRFLKDTTLLQKIIEGLPADYDLAMMNHMKPSSMSMPEYASIFKQPKINGYWVRFRELTSSGCYAMSRKGMERYLRAYEKPAICNSGAILYHDDFYYQQKFMGDDANLYVAVPVPSIQTVCGAGISHSDLAPYFQRNESIGIYSQDYASSGENSESVAPTKSAPCIPVETNNLINWMYRLMDRKGVQSKIPRGLDQVEGSVLGKLWTGLITDICPSVKIRWSHGGSSLRRMSGGIP